ncbi:MAG: hypothetical protein R2731_19730 [Nocardioides sp.]
MELVNEETLSYELARRDGVVHDAATFRLILRAAVDSSASLTATEAAFLADHAGVAPAPDEIEARVRVAVETARADELAAEAGYSTSELAELMGTAPANVRRHVARGDLRPAGRTPAGEHVFARWQVSDGALLPHLREVYAELPDDLHPLDVATFMTDPAEALRGRSPAAWLASGGPVEPVLALAGEWARVTLAVAAGVPG